MESRNYPIDETLELAIAGDLEAFGLLYSKFQGRTYSVIFRILRNSYDAEDTNQRLWLNLIRKISQFEGRSAFNTWLHISAVRQALMFIKAKKQKKELLYIGDTHDMDQIQREEEGIPQIFSTPPEFFREEEKILNKIWVEQTLPKLAAGYFTILLMHDYDGFEHQEIAKILGKGEGTSKSQLHKGRKKMKKHLNVQY